MKNLSSDKNEEICEVVLVNQNDPSVLNWWVKIFGKNKYFAKVHKIIQIKTLGKEEIENIWKY